MAQEARIEKLSDVRKFITAGSAIFTLRSKTTGERRTFEVEKAPPKDGMPEAFFVRSLRGPDNTRDYQYTGLLREQGAELRFSPKGDSISTKGFAWLCAQINFEIAGGNFHAPKFYAQAEFWHVGRCGRCGRLLTTPESIASGIGPVCAKKGGF